MTENTTNTDDANDRTTEHAHTRPLSPPRLDAIREHTISFDISDPDVGIDKVESLRERLEPARVVGLGESTHGTREFFQLKHRLVRHLVTEHDVRAIALESNFAETLAIDEYVVHGTGSLDLALDGIYFWTWTVESVRDLFEWLRSFNRCRPIDDRVRVYGLDIQYTQGAVDWLVSFFEAADPGLDGPVLGALDAVGDGGIAPAQSERSDAGFDRAIETVRRVTAHVERHRETYRKRRGRRRVVRLAKQLSVLERTLRYRRAVRAWDRATAPRSATVARLLQYRDREMADTAAWVLEATDADQLAIWAHDDHVNRVLTRDRNSDISAPSMGRYLADRYGPAYVAVGFAFGRGSFQAVGPPAPSSAAATSTGAEGEHPDGDESTILRRYSLDARELGDVEAILDELGECVTVLDIRDAAADDRLAGWLGTPLDHVSIGATFDPSCVEEFIVSDCYADAFDVLCYVDRTTRALPLDGE
ncbi:erythromycin esterase family protein [Halovivax limisalsi]|uniref:erythromycin esterase family protein n=1 Tax=Halovivax limisalsi TaxID=1453760 RepID=UPI001FFD76C3|nr:erythromycin esterase family protein [Halovivax limisalsi]